MSIKISGILEDGVGNPIPNCTIELKAKKTTLRVIAKTEANILIDQLGSYSMNVNPGEYQVTLSVSGYPKNSVGDIRVYSDSTPGSLNDFLMLPGESDLTPELVLIFQQLRDESKLAAKAAEQSQLASETVQERAEEIQSDIAGKKAQIEATAEIVELQCSDAKTSAQAASGNADKTAQDLLATSALKDSAENAALRAQVSSRTSDESAIRAEAAADLVKTLSAEATTLTPSAEATAFWDANTNTLNLGVPQGIKGNTGPEGVQGIQGIQGEQGVKGDKGDKGDVGAQAELSPLLTAISSVNTTEDQLVYSNGTNTVATTPLTQVARNILGQTSAEDILDELNISGMDDFANSVEHVDLATNKVTMKGSITNKGFVSDGEFEINYGGKRPYKFYSYSEVGGISGTVSPDSIGHLVLKDANYGLEIWSKREQYPDGGGTYNLLTTRDSDKLQGVYTDFVMQDRVNIGPSCIIKVGTANLSVWTSHVFEQNGDYWSWTMNSNGVGSSRTFVRDGNILGPVWAGGNLAGQLNSHGVSDRNHKVFIKPTEVNPMDYINQMEFVQFGWKYEVFPYKDTEDVALGVIAQDLQKIDPALVVTRPDGSLGVDTLQGLAVALAAIKQLNERVIELENKITK